MTSAHSDLPRRSPLSSAVAFLPRPASIARPSSGHGPQRGAPPRPAPGSWSPRWTPRWIGQNRPL